VLKTLQNHIPRYAPIAKRNIFKTKEKKKSKTFGILSFFKNASNPTEK